MLVRRLHIRCRRFRRDGRTFGATCVARAWIPGSQKYCAYLGMGKPRWNSWLVEVLPSWPDETAVSYQPQSFANRPIVCVSGEPV